MKTFLIGFVVCIVAISSVFLIRNNGGSISVVEFYFSSSQSWYIDEFAAKSSNEILQLWRELPPSTHHRQASILILAAQQLLQQGKLREGFSLLSAAASLSPYHERLPEVCRRLLQSSSVLAIDPDQYDQYLSFTLKSSPGREAGIIHDAMDYFLCAQYNNVPASKLQPLLHRIKEIDVLCAAILTDRTTLGARRSSDSNDRRADASHRPFMSGCTLGLFSKEDSFNYNTIVDEIKKLHSNWIALVFLWKMESFESSLIDPHGGDTVNWETLIDVTRFAKSRGLKVLWFPVITVKSSDYKHWRGNIIPRDEYEWFLNYTSILNVTARLAEIEFVDGISIGSEFNSLQENGTMWKSCVSSVRLRFHGLVTYSANWDSYKNVSFAHSVDMLGVTGYFQLSSRFFPDDKELFAAWAQHKDELIEWSQEANVPIYFSEVGYPSLSSAAMQPWNYCATSGIDLYEQKRCYEAFYVAWHKMDLLRGVFFYEFYHPGGIHDGSYSPRGKPAEKIIERWFAMQPG